MHFIYRFHLVAKAKIILLEDSFSVSHNTFVIVTFERFLISLHFTIAPSAIFIFIFK